MLRWATGMEVFGEIITSGHVHSVSRWWLVDANRDHRPDFADVDVIDQRIHFSVAQPDGTFRAMGGVTLAGFLPDLNRFAVGDFDGDGYTDVASFQKYLQNWSFSYFWGSGDLGKFTNSLGLGNYEGAAVRGPFEAADIDGDGVMELVAGGSNEELLVVRASKRKPSMTRFPFRYAPNVSFDSALGADIDGDGLRDVVFRSGRAIGIASRLPDGTLGAPSYFDLPGALGYMLADVDGDGLPDVAAAGGRRGLPVLYGRSLSGGGQAASIVPTGAIRGAQVADVNGDGIPDLVSLNSDQHSVRVFLADSNGHFVPGPESPLAAPQFESLEFVVTIGDFDGDGRVDIAVRTTGSVGPAIYFGDGAGRFGPEKLTLDVGEILDQVVLDGVGHPALISRRGNDVFVTTISAGRSASTAPVTTVPQGITKVLAVDIDGDDRSEIMITGADDISRIMKRSGQTWAEATTIRTIPFTPKGVEAADLNGDGRRDLVIYADSSSVRVYLSSGVATYEQPTIIGAIDSVISAALADFDLDGALDLMVVTGGAFTEPGSVQIFRGSGDGKFEPYSYALIRQPFGRAVMTDVDHDGWLDVAVPTDNGLEILWNVCATPRLRIAPFPTTVAAGERVQLFMNALYATSVDIREGAAQPSKAQSVGLDTFVWTSPSLTSGTHVYTITHHDHLAGPSSMTITITATSPPPRRRATRP